MAGTYFNHLNYSLGDEDTSVEHHILPPGTENVVAIAGSGGRVIPLLARSPANVTCIDISDTQLALTELRIAALKALEHPDYLGLLGYEEMPAVRRCEIISGLSLSDPARMSLQPVVKAIASGERIIYLGRFERMLRTLARLNALFTRQGGRGLFEHQDLESQQRHLESKFPTGAWKLILMLLGNSAVLNSLLYRGDFPKKNRPGSAYSIYRDIFDRLFRTIPARKSFFLQMVFFGELRYREGYLLECDPSVYQAAQQAARSSRIDFVRGDIIQHVQRGRGVGFVSLSDVPSFLPPRRDRGFLAAMKPGLTPGGLVVSRGHLRVVEPDTRDFERVSSRYEQAIAAETTQLWTIDVFQRVSGPRAKRQKEQRADASR
ncbi:MAG TPA: DUF3419 family protein [Archangium sp.]|nr:DUF3419 family protein [Archangium sp.]